MNPFHRALIPALLALLVVSAAHAARTYKWVDEDGVTHYTQYPPPDQEAQIIEPNIGVPSGTSGDGGQSDKQSADASGGSTSDDPKTIEEYCERLRSQLKVLNSSKSVNVKNEDGTLTSLDDDARASRRADVAAQISEHCN